jgi:histidyl-tRNA synthetase
VPLKVATHGPAFRYERPQKGRFRQFHQLDAEIIGAAEAQADVEILCFGSQLLQQLGIAEGVTLELNTLGDPESRDAWRGALVEHFRGHRSQLSEDSVARLERNPLRILDSKDPKDRAIAATAPPIDDYLTLEAADFFARVTAGLDSAGVAWVRNPGLVRGLDYYRHTAFEFVTDRLGAQGTLIAGGRYDGLIEALGGPSTPAIGWAAGIERLAMMIAAPERESPDAVVIPIGDEAAQWALEVAARLRAAHFATEILATGKLKKRMSRAAESGALAALIIGDDELSKKQVQFKDMATGEQRLLSVDDVFEPLMDLSSDREFPELRKSFSDLSAAFEGLERLEPNKE